jgi:hypothetical protein
MDTVESKGTIRRIIEEGGTLLVSFPNHDGYFRVTDQAPGLKERILKAQQNREEISFTFDNKLNILKVTSGPR